jgi:glycosyltransferase involved in cell wall biosynthesis
MTAAPPPFFSIVVPTHRRPLLLERALKSLSRQTFQDFETIVVADMWDRDTATVAADVLRHSSVFIKRSGQAGPAISRNMGLNMAKGEWVIFLDDDDTFEPHHLQALYTQAYMQGFMVLFTDCVVVTEDRNRDGTPELSRDKLHLIDSDVNSLWVKNFIPIHSLAYRRSAITGCSFDPHLSSLEDWDFILSVCSRSMPKPYAGGGAVIHKDYVNPGGSRGSQETANNSIVILDYLHIYRRWPAPTSEIKMQRQALLRSVGMDFPLEWF